MFPHINPTTTAAWDTLARHAETMQQTHLKDLFRQDGNRFQKYSFLLGDMLFDLSKNILTEETLQDLLQLAAECKLKEGISALFDGDFINETEHRSVLHVALRNFSDEPVYSAGKNVMPDVRRVQNQMKAFCDR